MSADQIIRDIAIIPKHGDRKAVITWDVAPGYEGWEAIVAYSPDGMEWLPLNADAPVEAGVGSFVDTRLNINDPITVGYYQIMLRNLGQVEFSKPVGIFGQFTRREYGLFRGILHQEFVALRTGQGIPVWHCIPKAAGPRAVNWDPDVGQTRGHVCSANDKSLGSDYAEAFHAPVLTWIRTPSVQREVKDSDAQSGSIITETIAAKFIAWPIPKRGHMVVMPHTDKRYLVGDSVRTYGRFPLAHSAQLEYLAQDDPRYKFEVPDIDRVNYIKAK